MTDKLGVGTCVTWKQGASPDDCNGVDGVLPGTSSKCRCETSVVINVAVIATASFTKKAADNKVCVNVGVDSVT